MRVQSILPYVLFFIFSVAAPLYASSSLHLQLSSPIVGGRMMILRDSIEALAKKKGIPLRNIDTFEDYNALVDSIGREDLQVEIQRRLSAFGLAGARLSDGIVQLVQGERHTLALTSSGEVYAWGDNFNGQLGVDSLGQDTPVRLTTLPPGELVRSVAAGAFSSYILTESALYTFGLNNHGQLALGNTEDRSSPTRVNLPLEAGESISDVWAGDYFVFMRTSLNRLFVSGDNRSGQLGLCNLIQDQSSPQSLMILPFETRGSTRISLGASHTIIQLNPETVYSVGANELGQLGREDFVNRNYFGPLYPLSGIPIIDVAAGGFHTVAVSEAGQLFIFGFDQSQTSSEIARLLLTERVQSVAAGKTHTVVLTKSGKVYVFGPNFSGQLGFDNNHSVFGPVLLQIPDNEAVTEIAATRFSTLLRTASGRTYVLGNVFCNSHNMNLVSDFWTVRPDAYGLLPLSFEVPTSPSVNNTNPVSSPASVVGQSSAPFLSIDQ